MRYGYLLLLMALTAFAGPKFFPLDLGNRWTYAFQESNHAVGPLHSSDFLSRQTENLEIINRDLYKDTIRYTFKITTHYDSTIFKEYRDGVLIADERNIFKDSSKVAYGTVRLFHDTLFFDDYDPTSVADPISFLPGTFSAGDTILYFDVPRLFPVKEYVVYKSGSVYSAGSSNTLTIRNLGTRGGAFNDRTFTEGIGLEETVYSPFNPDGWSQISKWLIDYHLTSTPVSRSARPSVARELRLVRISGKTFRLIFPESPAPQTENIAVYTADGKLMRRLDCRNNNSISIEGVGAGAYVLRIESKSLRFCQLVFVGN
jgi:hypothetical protein